MNKYPHVTYSDIISGYYKRQYVIISAVINSIEYNELMNCLECDLWLNDNDSYVKDSATFYCDKLKKYLPKLLQSGDSLDICFYINADNSFGSDIIGFCRNNNDVSLDNISTSFHDSFIESCSTLDYEALIITPENYFKNNFVISGEVLQVISDKDGQVVLLFFLGDDKYVRLLYEYKEDDLRVLKGDKLIVYGTFYKLYNYSTNIYDSIPNIYVEFIENTSVLAEEDIENSRSIQKEAAILTAINRYKFKNSIDDVKLEFEEIYLISNWDDVLPHNNSFLIMKVTASCNTPGNDIPYKFPHTIVGSNGTEYKSINEDFHYNYEDSNGNTIDISTDINLGFVWKEEGKIRAYNTNLVLGGNGVRYLVFDIPRDVALSPNSYLIFFGTEREMFRNDAPPTNIYFSQYVISE